GLVPHVMLNVKPGCFSKNQQSVSNIGESMADSIEPLFPHKAVDEGDSTADPIEPLFTQKVVDEGENVTLSCSYSNLSDTVRNLYWYRHYPKAYPKFLLYINPFGGKTKPMPPRLDAKVDKTKKQVDLIIFSAAVSDSALYYCAQEPTVTGNPAALYKNLNTV
ncbi:hypothetical protein HF521_019311, partial [Silurus meridionalis]